MTELSENRLNWLKHWSLPIFGRLKTGCNPVEQPEVVEVRQPASNYNQLRLVDLNR